VEAGGVEISFTAYPFAPAEPPFDLGARFPPLAGVRVATPKDIAMMKAYALGCRADFRDYADLYFLLREGHVSLGELIEGAEKKFAVRGEPVFSGRLFLEQLVCPEDLEEVEATLKLLFEPRLDVARVSRFMKDEVKRFLAGTVSGPRARGAREGEKRVPALLADLFRNYVLESLDTGRHAGMIIKTVLARGTWRQVEWLFGHYGAETLGRVFEEDCCGLRVLPESARRLWSLVFGDAGSQQADEDEIEKWRPRRVPPGARPAGPEAGGAGEAR